MPKTAQLITRTRISLASLVVALFFTGPTAAVEPGLPSKTAVAVAGFRALGAYAQRPEFRNPDYLAEKFMGPEEAELMQDSPWASIWSQPFAESARKSRNPEAVALGMTLRTLHVDDELLKAVRSGVSQVVILGAGYDSRAYRFADELSDATVFELDFPPTQEHKKNRVREALGKAPDNVVYAPIDFTKESLQEALMAAGYSEEKPTFFIWEGVTYYLTQDEVMDTLRFVANHSGPGSSILFNFPAPDLLERETAFEKWAAASGEPWTFAASGPKMRALVNTAGLVLDRLHTYGEVFRKYMPADEPLSRYIPLRTTRNQQFCLARKP